MSDSNPTCYICGTDMVPKPPSNGHTFYECPNCGLDTEEDYDKAQTRLMELGQI